MKDIREYRSVENIYTEFEKLNEQMLEDIKQIFKERGITTLRIFADDEGRNWSDGNFNYDQAYDNSTLIYLNYINEGGYYVMGFIYEVSVTNDKGISVCLYDDSDDHVEDDFEFTTKDILDIYDAVISAVMRNDIEGYAYDYKNRLY